MLMPVPRPRPMSSRRRLHRRALLPLLLLTALVPRVASAGQLQLSWLDNSAGEASFRIERKAGTGGMYGELALEAPGVTTYTDASVIDGTTYCYRVQAYDSLAVSPYSNEACGSTATGLTLTVSPSGTGQGTVTSNPAGINCGLDCTEAYGSGVVVTLSAAATNGSVFGGWNGGGCSGTGTCTLIGNTPVTVAVTFTTASTTPTSSYPLSVAKAGPGMVTSTPAGISCGTDCSESYVSNTAVTLTASPAKGARFVGWSGGGCAGTQATCSVLLHAATSVSATFSKGQGKK